VKCDFVNLFLVSRCAPRLIARDAPGTMYEPRLRLLKIRPRPFYNTRHTYLSYMLAIGARPLWVARQTGTSLEMIEQHYGDVRCSSGELDALISAAKNGRTRNLPGTFDDESTNDVTADEKSPDESGLHRERATGVEPATSSLGMGRRRNRTPSICQGEFSDGERLANFRFH
jgi:hypothetical protein